MESKPLILIADDHDSIRDVIAFALQKDGYRTLSASTGTDALRVFHESKPQLVILDIMMPGLDGLEVCRSIRKTSDCPIIFLSSKDEELDRILGLEMGGDDYMSKPFSPKELVTRCKVVLRRSQRQASQGIATSSKAHGKLEMNSDLYQVAWEKKSVVLTATEFSVLETLLRHPGKVYSRDELIDSAYGGEVTVSDRTIDSHIRRLRRKFQELGGDPIETIHGVGYKLSSC